MDTITLRVAEAPANLVGRGIAVMDPKVIQENRVDAGEVVESTGSQKTYAKVWPGQAPEYGKGLIRIDGLTRNNAGVGIDDRVTVRRAEAKMGTQLTLYPTEPLRIVGGDRYPPQLLD